MLYTIDEIREKASYLFALDLAAKIRWRKRFERDPKFIRLQDKIAVREYAAERGVAAAGILYVTDDPRTIPFSDLPANYMIKATHGSGWNIICLNSRHYLFGDGRELVELLETEGRDPSGSKRYLGHEEVIELCRIWMHSVFNPAEWAYRHIPPRIVVEPLLQPRLGPELMDYRFYTFNGEVKAINVDSARYMRDKLEAVFDADWNLVELCRLDEALPAVLPERPATLAEMIACAGRLGEGVSFARIDFYDEANGIVLGEVTIYPQSGGRGTPTRCPHFNRWLGDQWQMSPAQRRQVMAWNLALIFPDLINSVMFRLRSRKRDLRRIRAHSPIPKQNATC